MKTFLKHSRFRGFSNKSNKWVYGHLIRSLDKAFIVTDFVESDSDLCKMSYHEVAVESVGQFIDVQTEVGPALWDVYENDIVKTSNDELYIVRREQYVFLLYGFNDTSFQFPWDAFSEELQFEIVGNSYETPELLERLVRKPKL